MCRRAKNKNLYTGVTGDIHTYFPNGTKEGRSFKENQTPSIEHEDNLDELLKDFTIVESSIIL